MGSYKRNDVEGKLVKRFGGSCIIYLGTINTLIVSKLQQCVNQVNNLHGNILQETKHSDQNITETAQA